MQEHVNAVASFRSLFPRLYQLARAIQGFEGYRPGSRAFRSNNPGNLRSSRFGSGMRDGFATFDNYFEGFFALMWDLWVKCDGRSTTGLKPTSTLQQLIETWAPAEDGNNPTQYASHVAARLGVGVDTRLDWFLE